MKPAASHLAQLLEQRLTLLRLLAVDLLESRFAFRALNLGAIETHIFRQRSLVSKISSLGDEIKPLLKSSASRMDDDFASALVPLRSQTRVIVDEVRRLNHIYAGFLCGARRTLTALSNLLASYAPTYDLPARASSASTLPEYGA
jgi:hypothetical protein